MRAYACPDRKVREQIISAYVRPVAMELRSLELDLLLKNIMTLRSGNLESVVEASSELYFKPGTLRYNRISEIELQWGCLPKVRLVLTLDSHGVTVSFALQLDTFSAGVDLQYASFPAGLTAKAETQLLRQALRKARRKSGRKQPCAGRHSSAQRPMARPTQVFANKLI